MLSVICFTLYIIHNITLFWYFSHVFLRAENNRKLFLLALVINSFALSFLLNTLLHECIVMGLYLLFLTVEVKLIFRESWMKTFLGGICFSLNFFAIRLIYIVVYSLGAKCSITDVMESRVAALHIMIFTLATAIPYMIAFKMFFPKINMDSILSERGNLKFMSAIVGFIYLYLMLNTRNLYIKETFHLMPLFQVKIAVCALLGFGAAFFYAFLFARLKLYAEKYKKIQREVKDAEETVRELENEAYHDGFTRCYTRAFADRELDRLLCQRIPFSLIYIDMDGLKAANDTYGHNEGDFYILAVAGILKEKLPKKLIARVGGDEFLVIMEQVDSYEATKSAVYCYESVRELGSLHKKPYSTSISYGILEVTAANTLSREELLRLVDKRMYSFKKSRQRNRIIRKPE